MIVAVCGLHGGAGTTTVALLLAEAAAAAAAEPVLLCDTDPCSGDLALALGAQSVLALPDIAHHVDAGQRPVQLWNDLPGGLRLIAQGPRRGRDANPATVARILADAAAAHALVVVDAGRLTAPHALGVLPIADHVIWTLDATADMQQCAGLLTGPLSVIAQDARWTLAASATGRSAEPHGLRELPAMVPAISHQVLVAAVGRLGAEDPARQLSGMQLLSALD
jgi:hypothetical protein